MVNIKNLDASYVSAVKKYFDDRIENLRNLEILSGKENRKDFDFEILLLACCYIDALANIFTEEKEVGKRFIESLICFGETNGISFSKVNLIFLHKNLIEHRSYKHSLFPTKYDDWVLNEIHKRDYSTGDNTEFDLPEKEILKRLGDMLIAEEMGLFGESLKALIMKSSYAGVLYETYRNPAVHEGLVVGHWGGVKDEARPFYVSVMGRRPDFTFPAKFLINVVENMLSKMYKECEDLFFANEV